MIDFKQILTRPPVAPLSGLTYPQVVSTEPTECVKLSFIFKYFPQMVA